MSKSDTTVTKWISKEDYYNWVTPFEELKQYITIPEYYTPVIVGIMDYNPNEYIVKIQLNFCHYPDSNSVSLNGIYNLIIHYDSTNRTYKFKDYRNFYLSNYLDTIKQGNIIYFAKNPHKLNKIRCDEFNKYNSQIAEIFKVKPKEISYISLKNSSELHNFLGWDIVYNMFYAPKAGYAKLGGKKTRFENTILSGNNDERYDHELIHLYFNELLNSDTTKSTLIIFEGIPTYFGGSSGKTYLELKTTLKHYLEKNDTTKIQNHFIEREVNIQIDKNTNYIYSMGAFIAELYYKKDGYNGLKELANYTDDNFLKNVSKYFNVKEEELDRFLRTKIKQ